MTYWSAHTHSKFSAKDALPSIDKVVATAVELGYPALGLTDHGSMGGSAQLYKTCRKAGIEPLPGMEAYVAIDRAGNRPQTMHMGLLATSEIGYRNMVGLSSLAHANFKYKPILDFGDLAYAAENGLLDGVAATTGCWFGMVPTLMRDGDWNSVRNVLEALRGWFGSGTYVEVQNHLIVDAGHDDDIYGQQLLGLASVLGLPMILAQDSHYCHLEDRPAHEEMKRLMSWSTDPDDAVFPGDGYHMVDEEWMADHHSQPIFDAGMAGLDDLLAKAKVVIPELDTFALRVPDTTITGDPDAEIVEMCEKALAERIADGTISKSRTKEYQQRLADEVDVVSYAGFAGYLLFTATVTDFMRREGIFFGVRGSAAGSLINWLIGITFHDPIVWGLQFDRFLSKDKTKPPDIDLDVEHGRREEVVEWLDERYTVSHIGTWLKLGLKDEEDLDSGEQKGSLMVRWKMNARKMGRDPDRRLAPSEWDALLGVAAFEPFQSYGVHAAGLLIIPDEQAGSGIPIQYVASSKTFVTAFDMNDIEAFGLVKLDVLGLKTMTAIKTMSSMTGVDIWDIPFSDRKVYSRIGAGNTAGMFQLDGYSFTTGCQRMKPHTIHEIIAAQALFRPAVMKSGATEQYLDRRAKREPVPDQHPIIMEHTKDTYGVVVYQEQVINVLKGIGMPIEQIEAARKAIKASQSAAIKDAVVAMHKIIAAMHDLAVAKGMSEKDIEFLNVSLNAYAMYGFNKAHATAYGTLAYITGWFAVNYPVEYWVSLLNAYVGDKQESAYLTAARKDGVKIRSPHVNLSDVHYTADVPRKTIRKGLMAVKGVGEKSASELITHQPYTSLVDLGARVNARRVSGARSLRSGHSPAACGGVVAALDEAGAFTGLPVQIEIEEIL
jgi:DNA polymerase-3 subunit alpha